MRKAFKSILGCLGLSVGSGAIAQSIADPYELSTPVTTSLGISLGQELTVAAGDTIVSNKRFRDVPGAILLDPISAPPRMSVIIDLPSGSSLYSIKTSRAFKACAIDVLVAGWPPCMIDDDGDGTFDRIAQNNVAKAVPLSQSTQYRKIDSVEVPAPNGGFERVLIYQGGNAQELRFSYREFSGSLARPAFEEQLSIPIDGVLPQQFAIKGLVFTAIKVGSMGLTLQLDSVDVSRGWPTPNPRSAE